MNYSSLLGAGALYWALGRRGPQVRCLRLWNLSVQRLSPEAERGLATQPENWERDVMCSAIIEHPLCTRPEGFDDCLLQGLSEVPPHSHTPL